MSLGDRVSAAKDWTGGSWLNVFQVVMAGLVPVVITAVIFLFALRVSDQQKADQHARSNTCVQSVQSHNAEIDAFHALINKSLASPSAKVESGAQVQVLADAYHDVEAACFHAARVAGGGR
jgi:hypothetical protein